MSRFDTPSFCAGVSGTLFVVLMLVNQPLAACVNLPNFILNLVFALRSRA